MVLNIFISKLLAITLKDNNLKTKTSQKCKDRGTKLDFPKCSISMLYRAYQNTTQYKLKVYSVDQNIF